MVLLALNGYAKEKTPKPPSKGLLFFYRIGDKVDRYLTSSIDTNYIALPEHSWRLAYTNGMLGVNSTISTVFSDEIDGKMQPMEVALLNRTTPSVDLGFNVGYRGFGFGYSWDALHAYSQKMSFSLGSKRIGIDFAIQTSTNINTSLAVDNKRIEGLDFKNNVIITNANLNIWYALNATRYSHQAAIKQSYIQRKTAGSPLIFLSYMSSQVELSDTLRVQGVETPLLPMIMSGMTAVRTRQIAIGVGYGINYTPNNGKVVLHADAAALLVTYSVNLISFYLPDSIMTELPDQPMYNIRPSFPVHVTGNVRAAVSWEINEWVHLSAWATGENMRFKSAATSSNNPIFLSNWNWKVQLTVGVRLGAGRKRVQRALGEPELVTETVRKRPQKELPVWVKEYFYSPRP